MIPALDVKGNVAAEVVDLDHSVRVVREQVGQRQCHHHRGQARLHVERALAAARIVRVGRDLGVASPGRRPLWMKRAA